MVELNEKNKYLLIKLFIFLTITSKITPPTIQYKLSVILEGNYIVYSAYYEMSCTAIHARIKAPIPCKSFSEVGRDT